MRTPSNDNCDQCGRPRDAVIERIEKERDDLLRNAKSLINLIYEFEDLKICSESIQYLDDAIARADRKDTK